MRCVGPAAYRLPTNTRTILIAAVLLLGMPREGSADWLITPFLGITFAGDTNLNVLQVTEPDTQPKKTTFGAQVTVLGDGVFGAEADFGYSPKYFQREDPESLVI